MADEQITTGLADGNDNNIDTNPPANDDANLNADAGNNNAADGQDPADNNLQNENKNNDAKTNSENNPEYYGAPETYDFKDIKIPEGYEYDAKLADKFAPIAKELNLSQQGANKLANLLVEYQQEQAGTAKERIAEFKKQELIATQLSYEKMLNADQEIGGGDKDKMNAYLDRADIGYDAFASDGLKEVLRGLHLDYHPEVIKHFYRLGKLCGNDKIAKTGKPSGSTMDAADVLYGNSGK